MTIKNIKKSKNPLWGVFQDFNYHNFVSLFYKILNLYWRHNAQTHLPHLSKRHDQRSGGMIC